MWSPMCLPVRVAALPPGMAGVRAIPLRLSISRALDLARNTY